MLQFGAVAVAITNLSITKHRLRSPSQRTSRRLFPPKPIRLGDPHRHLEVPAALLLSEVFTQLTALIIDYPYIAFIPDQRYSRLDRPARTCAPSGRDRHHVRLLLDQQSGSGLCPRGFHTLIPSYSEVSRSTISTITLVLSPPEGVESSAPPVGISSVSSHTRSGHPSIAPPHSTG